MPRILLVDDDPGIRSAVKRMFVRRGYEVEAFGAVDEMLETLAARASPSLDIPATWPMICAEAQKFDVVISDYELGDEKTGLDVLHFMREAPVRILYTGRPELAELDLRARCQSSLEGVKIVPKESDITEYVDTTLRQR